MYHTVSSIIGTKKTAKLCTILHMYVSYVRINIRLNIVMRANYCAQNFCKIYFLLQKLEIAMYHMFVWEPVDYTSTNRWVYNIYLKKKTWLGKQCYYLIDISSFTCIYAIECDLVYNWIFILLL